MHQETHLKKFADCYSDKGVWKSNAETWMGRNTKSWWKHVTKNEECKLEDKRLTREGVKAICSNNDFSDRECLAAIMAWGGQKIAHGKLLFDNSSKITDVIHELRYQQLDRIAAYDRFHRIWVNHEANGIGAAYFTKIIFFCGHDNDGYIMDQWTSKSANLLSGKDDLIHLISGHVSKKNDAKTYANFCSLIEELAKKFHASGEMIEMAMFSKGGHKKDLWRQYVIEQFNEKKCS